MTVPDGHFLEIEEMLAGDSLPGASDGLMLLIDRLAVAGDGDELSRLAESAETAFFEGRDEMVLLVWTDEGLKEHRFSKRFEADGITFREPSELMFNFNNPYGACPVCEGFGKTVGIDPALVVPDTSLSVYDDAVVCWRGGKMSECKRDLIRLAPQLGFPIHKPYCELTPDELDILWHGRGKFYGIDGFFKWVDENQYKIQYRVMKARYRGKTVCPECHGSRLKPDASYVKIGGRTIMELVSMPVADLRRWFSELVLDDTESRVATRLLMEINSRIGFLCDVGLGYLTLDRLSSTLSGGESQRINLATSLGSSLVGSLYILDEPSIGLHPRDTAKLVEVLRRLQMIGNTVVIVEHDADIMRAADYLIDVGRDAGRLGGNIVYQGPVNPLPVDTADSYTVKYLRGDLSVPLPAQRRRWKDYIEVVGAREHNLKNIDVRFPLGVMTVVTGVSGSGKSTLVRDVFWRAMVRRLGEAGDAPGLHKELRGDLSRIKAVEFVDQDLSDVRREAMLLHTLRLTTRYANCLQISRVPSRWDLLPLSSRSILRADDVRNARGRAPSLSRCSLWPISSSRVRRVMASVSSRRYLIYVIADRISMMCLKMTVNQAIEFFGEDATSLAKKIVKRLKPLQDVGLGYIKLGQSSSTLSGGENQRVKLAYYLAQEKPEPTMFIFDEPTTGLHLNDINKLMDSFNRLIAQGHTVLIIEHNLDVIKCADHVIDIGPEGWRPR